MNDIEGKRIFRLNKSKLGERFHEMNWTDFGFRELDRRFNVRSIRAHFRGSLFRECFLFLLRFLPPPFILLFSHVRFFTNLMNRRTCQNCPPRRRTGIMIFSILWLCTASGFVVNRAYLFASSAPFRRRVPLVRLLHPERRGPVITPRHRDCRDRLTHENVIRISLLPTALRNDRFSATRVCATLFLSP